PGETPRVRKIEEVHQQGRGHPEGDQVDQRIQLRTEAGPGAGKSGHPAIQHVENPGKDDEPSRPPEIAVERRHDRPETKEQIAEGEGTRHHDHNVAHGGSGKALAPLSQLHSATTDTPTSVLSPVLTRTRVFAGGRKRSTREPKRIIPIRSP